MVAEASQEFTNRDGGVQVSRFYRTPRGRLVQVIEAPVQGRQIRIRYWGMYGLGWQTMWIPKDAPLMPAPEFSEFPDPGVAEEVLLGCGPVRTIEPSAAPHLS